MKRRPRILLADDHCLLLEAFVSLLQPHYNIVGTAENGRRAIELALETSPDIIILDISMPELNGMDAYAQLRLRQPDARVIFLTVNEDPDIAAEAIALGASAFLLKSSASAELSLAIESALAGQTYITPLILKGKPLSVFLDNSHKPSSGNLTLRQREVLQLLAEGKAMKEAARILDITPRTIAFHKYTIMGQLGLNNTAELVQYALENHLVAPRG